MELWCEIQERQTQMWIGRENGCKKKSIQSFQQIHSLCSHLPSTNTPFFIIKIKYFIVMIEVKIIVT